MKKMLFQVKKRKKFYGILNFSRLIYRGGRKGRIFLFIKTVYS